MGCFVRSRWLENRKRTWLHCIGDINLLDWESIKRSSPSALLRNTVPSPGPVSITFNSPFELNWTVLLVFSESPATSSIRRERGGLAGITIFSSRTLGWTFQTLKENFIISSEKIINPYMQFMMPYIFQVSDVTRGRRSWGLGIEAILEISDIGRF